MIFVFVKLFLHGCWSLISTFDKILLIVETWPSFPA